MSKKWAIVLFLNVAANVIFSATVGIIAIKQHWFVHHKDQPYTYLDNPEFVEQTDLALAFQRHTDYVMLGDSHIQKEQWSELMGKQDIANRGIGGDITSGYLARINQVLLLTPKICFIEGGGNDIEHHIPLDTIVAHLRQIVFKLRYAGCGATVATVPLESKRVPGSSSYNKQVQQLNEKIRHLRDEDGRIDVMDIADWSSEDGYLKEEYAQADGVHLTCRAYDTWAAEIATRIMSYEAQERYEKEMKQTK